MIKQFPKESSHFILPGPAGNLEIKTTYPKDADANSVGIICHPHPLQSGTMNNKVVTTLARSFESVGFATVRFNFRGVGASEGSHGHTIGETEDLLAVIDWVRSALPDCDLSLAGFSFGSYIAAKVANQMQVSCLISIAPPVNHVDFKSLTNIRCPWLVVQGDQDEIVPIEEVQSLALASPSPFKLIVMEEVGHFFHGRLIELREIIENFLSKLILT